MLDHLRTEGDCDRNGCDINEDTKNSDDSQENCMLRSLGRNVVERSIVVQRRTSTLETSTLLFSRHRDLHRSNIISLSFARSLSSSTPPTKTTSSNGPGPIPPNPPTNRKPKVELRPGPIKPTDPARPPVGPAAVPKSAKKIPVAQVSLGPSSSPQLSVTETTKRDMEDAVKHGLLIPPPAHYNKFRQLIHQAIQLARFYWRGLKLINTHRIRVGEIKKRVAQGGPPISRWENRFIQTYRQDILKLIPFVIVVLVLEEIIPLIAIYAPFMLPSTCILPSQRDRIESTRTNKQIATLELYRRVFDDIRMKTVGGYVRLLAILAGDHAYSKALCMLLQLPSWGTNGFRIWRIHRHLARIAIDDELLMREDMGARLTYPELVEALHERGIVTAGLSQKDQELRLKWWLDSTKDIGTDDPITVRILAVAKCGAWQL